MQKNRGGSNTTFIKGTTIAPISSVADTIIYSDLYDKDTYSSSYVWQKGVKIRVAQGSFRVKWYGRVVTGGGTGSIDVRKNGVSIDIQTFVGSGHTLRTFDFSGLHVGDWLDFYVKNDDGSSHTRMEEIWVCGDIIDGTPANFHKMYGAYY